jgi:hypothetical protein
VLAAAIPVLTNDKTKSYPTFSTIMATQTQTHNIAAMGERNYNHAIKRSSPPGGEPPHRDPFRGFAAVGKAADRGGGGGGGEETMKEIPMILIIAEEDTLEAMASSVARNPPSSRAIERTLSLSYLSGRSTRC